MANKISKWVKLSSNDLQSYFGLSDSLLGNSHKRHDTSHCLVLYFNDRTLQGGYSYYPHFILGIRKQMRNSPRVHFLNPTFKLLCGLTRVLCSSDFSFLGPLLLFPCPASSTPSAPYRALLHLDPWAKIQIYLTCAMPTNWQNMSNLRKKF